MPSPLQTSTCARVSPQRRLFAAHQNASGIQCRAAQPAIDSGNALPPTSLIQQTLQELDSDSELLELHARVAQLGQAALTKQEDRQRRCSLDRLGAPSFSQFCSSAGVSPLRRGTSDILQLNIGLYCNQACKHCHVESSPRRTEELMTHAIAQRCIELLDSSPTIHTLDITGGAPELCPEFEYLVKEGRKRGLEVIDRCNLTVLLEPGQETLPEFLASHGVRIVASMPCYSQENVDSQRGRGVFDRSIRGLQLLNSVGYGSPGTGLILDLVYNPGGVFLAPPQASLEDSYRRELMEGYGITFSSLLCLNNMPIKRWADELVRRGQLEEYMALLVNGFNAAAAESVMCRSTVSVGWDGSLYDCDFNQQLALGLGGGTDAPKTVFDVDTLGDLEERPIALGSHCFGCTAGAGSSCQGAPTTAP